MAKPDPASRGLDLDRRLRDAVRAIASAPRQGARALPVLHGLNPKSIATLPLENVRAEATQLLVASQAVFSFGNTIVYQRVVGDDRRLVTLVHAGAVDPAAAAILANLFVCEQAPPDRPPIQFALPRPFASLLLSSIPVLEALPVIATYATRPVFDEEFRLLGPGWHPGSRTLVHGPDVEPCLPAPVRSGLPALDRLPPHLRALLANFCFASDADLVAAVAMLVTGLLGNHFVAAGKAIVLLDANQPGLGKTLPARVLGILLDGADPRLIHYTPDDEELAKRICATLRGGGQSVVLIDNAKLRAGGAISSPVIEANSMAPVVSLRILGVSANFERPNDLVWVLTMNETRTSADLLSRSLPIRLRHHGDPARREFAGADPVAYAAGHRVELLGELAGLVVRWDQAGRPEGTRGHRCDRWARVVGGILEAAGLVEFLANADEAAASFNQALDEVSALAEVAADPDDDGRAIAPPAPAEPGQAGGRRRKRDAPGLLPGEWETLFRRAVVQAGSLEAARSQRARATLIGTFLGTSLGREVPISVRGHAGRARLVAHDAGKRQTRYAFEVAWDGDPPPARARPSDGPSDDPSDAPDDRRVPGPPGRRPAPR